jgi:hypothetical protein
MSKHFNFRDIVLFLFVIFIMASCASDDNKSDDTTNATASTTTGTSTSTAPAAEPKAAALTGTLHNLWAIATEFKDLQNNKKVVFSFTFRDPDILTTWGWQCKDANCTDNFSKVPDIEMNMGQATNVQYGPNVVFGNVVILKGGVKPIKDAIDKGYQYVVFVPQMDGEFIKYKIYVTNDDPKAAFTPQALQDTGIETNPSPPKNNTSD